jgi:hypothetical protein
MSTLDLNFLKAVLDILALAKAGAKALTKGLMEFLLMTMKAMDTLERRQKHVDRAFQYVRIFAAMEGLNYSENFLAPLREDAKRIADGTWDEYHQERADRTMEMCQNELTHPLNISSQSSTFHSPVDGRIILPVVLFSQKVRERIPFNS